VRQVVVFFATSISDSDVTTSETMVDISQAIVTQSLF